MKTLKHQTLVYDKDCPLCRAYTAGFVKTGMLDENGRLPYADLNKETCTFVDTDRARNEIALIDHQNNTVTYGIDSLLKVLGHSMPLIEKVGTTKPIYAFLKRLYSFISYNRKVIIPSAKSKNEAQCIPDFNLKYRIAYIAFAGLITALALYRYWQLMFYGGANYPLYIELFLALGQIPFQWLLIRKESQETQFEYYGNLMTVSLFGSLLLTLGIVAEKLFSLSENVLFFWFLATATIMFSEHYRRVKLLGLRTGLCAGWFLYRLLILAFVILCGIVSGLFTPTI